MSDANDDFSNLIDRYLEFLPAYDTPDPGSPFASNSDLIFDGVEYVRSLELETTSQPYMSPFENHPCSDSPFVSPYICDPPFDESPPMGDDNPGAQRSSKRKRTASPDGKSEGKRTRSEKRPARAHSGQSSTELV